MNCPSKIFNSSFKFPTIFFFFIYCKNVWSIIKLSFLFTLELENRLIIYIYIVEKYCYFTINLDICGANSLIVICKRFFINSGRNKHFCILQSSVPFLKKIESWKQLKFKVYSQSQSMANSIAVFTVIVHTVYHTRTVAESCVVKSFFHYIFIFSADLSNKVWGGDE